MRPLIALVLALTSAPALAGVTSVQAIDSTGAGTPDGFVTHDFVIDFEGSLRGQQMVVELTAGSIYQDVFGSNTAASPALIPAFPSLEFDTFVTIGGLFRGIDAETTLVIGGAANLPGDADFQFDQAGINVAWAPGTGINVPAGEDYVVARLTLSEDARGQVWYFGSTSGDDDPLVAAPGGNFPLFEIVGGMVRFPEPTSAVLVGLALAGFATRSRL